MNVIVNWTEQQNEIERCVEIPMFEEIFKIYFFNEVICKTTWCLKPEGVELEQNSLWLDVQQYLHNPLETLTVNLKKQGSDYRHKVWAAMSKIPVGQTQTYSELAEQIGSGARAVANACRDNPFPGIIPCHRVVAVSGIGGFMGQTSGRCLEIKRKLLASEVVGVKKMIRQMN